MLKPSPKPAARISAETAESLAIDALGFLAGEPERIGRFLAISGIESQDLRRAAAEPGFLAGVLAYLTDDESLTLAFAANAGISPDSVVKARHVLSPADERDTP